VEEALDRGGRLRAGELGHDEAVLERLDRRDARDAESGGYVLVGVGVDLDQVDLPVTRRDRLLKHGRELPAGAAPLGPEVHDHRGRARALDDVTLEGGLGGIDAHATEDRLRAVTDLK